MFYAEPCRQIIDRQLAARTCMNLLECNPYASDAQIRAVFVVILASDQHGCGRCHQVEKTVTSEHPFIDLPYLQKTWKQRVQCHFQFQVSLSLSIVAEEEANSAQSALH